MNQEHLHNDDDQLKQEAPFLFGLKKEEPYQAPAGYFEKFQAQLSDKIHTKKSSWWTYLLKPVVWAPAMVALLAGTFFLFNGSEKKASVAGAEQEKREIRLQDVSFEALDAYVNDHLLAQAHTDEIIEMVGEKNIPPLGIQVQAASINENDVPSIENIDEEEMEDYIMENIDDMEVY